MFDLLTLPLAAADNGLPLAWVMAAVAVIGGWLVLRLVGMEAEAQRKHLHADHQRRLHQQLLAIQEHASPRRGR